MRLLVRTWNVFHGNTVPAGRRAFLQEAVRLVAEDDPDVVCLQEVPVWALRRLEDWSGMQVFPAVGAPPRLGPLPSSAAIGRAVTWPNHGLLRSAFTGQANAILVSPRLRAEAIDTIVLNTRGFRRAQSAWLGLDLVYRLAWAARRRVCHAVRIRSDGGGAVVATTHTIAARDDRLSDAELLRAAAFADALAGADEACILAGDFNVTARRSRTLADLCSPEWGFSAAGSGIDHILVRGLPVSPYRRWPPERRRLDGRLLSDHAPIEVDVG